MTDFELMGAALEEARKAAALGEVPVGAVVAKDGEIISAAHNTRETEKNALHHAELLAIDAACKKLGGWRLWQCELFVTLEPCPMCSGAIINSRIKRVVYGAADVKAGCCCADAPVAARDEDGAALRRRGSALGLCRRFRLAFRCRCVLRRSADRRFPRFLHRRYGHSRFFRLGQGRPALFFLRPCVCKVKCQLKFVVVQESNPPVHYFRPQRLFVSKPLRRERKQLPPPRRSCALLTFSGLGRLCGAPGGICVVSTSFH